jgi:hypothetical protein
VRFCKIKIFREPFYARAQDLNASALFEFDLVTVLVGQRIFDAEFALSEVTRWAYQNDLPFP